MNSQSDWNELSRRIAELCVRIPGAAPSAVARELATIAPSLAFREVLTRGGWYRLGGVVDAAGTVADNIEQWAADELASHGDDMHALAEEYAGHGLMATRLTGKTHYWVTTVGAGTADYLQIEIEELQEVISHALFDDGPVPGSIEELVDPREGRAARPSPLGASFYTLRRVVHVGDFLERMRAQKPEPQAIHRFLTAWDESSARNAVEFSHHWVVAVREHLDRYQQPIYNATPIAAVNGQAPKFEPEFGARGLALQNALTRFDRQIGYPMAWFFHMLTTRNVPHVVAAAVVEDMQSGFRYLPERDVQVLKDWLHRPYAF